MPFEPPRVAILTYHDVTPRKTVWFDCTPKELEEQLDAMKAKGVTFISLDDIYAWVNGLKTLSGPCVAITFADNYAGWREYAIPILAGRKIPATQFAHTGYVGYSVGRPKNSWDQLRAVDRSLFTIGSQTVSHPADLRKLSDNALREEFWKSRLRLRVELGRRHYDLAYPNGKWDARVAKRAKAAGYRMAFTEEQKLVTRSVDPHRIPRWVHTKWRDVLRALTGARSGR